MKKTKKKKEKMTTDRKYYNFSDIGPNKVYIMLLDFEKHLDMQEFCQHIMDPLCDQQQR